MANKSKNINVPAKVILGAVNNPEKFDALCSWICIRNLYNNGVYTNVTQKKVRTDFGVGKQKGKEIFESFAACDEFFTMETPTRVRIKSLKSHTQKKDNIGRCYFSDVVFKIPVGSYSHKEVKNLLREMVVCYFINAVEHKEGLLVRSTSGYHAPVRAITMKQLATALNVSISTISRLTSKMHSKGLIEKHPSVWVNNADQRNEEEVKYILSRYAREKFTFTDKRGLSYIVMPCTYSVQSRDMSESFKHKIYNFNYSECPYAEEAGCCIPQLLGF